VAAERQSAEVEVLSRLAEFGTPSVANALEVLGQAPTIGFSDPSVGLLSASRPFIGRALTATMVSASPREPAESVVATESYWRYVSRHDGPSIVVVQDLDPQPTGAMFGEVQGRLHRALGVAGIVTNGGVRDLGELTAIDFPVIAGRACVSHAYARFRATDVPVTVGGLDIRPGDLLHADRHGVQRIPPEIDLEELAHVAGEIEARESELFAAADSATSLDAFLATWAHVRARWPSSDVRSNDAI
jgi:4-hydroxy-4-methyl-2-oxoglutarate aldolase